MTGNRVRDLLRAGSCALALLAAVPSTAVAQRLQVESTLDRSEIAVGEEATLTVTVTAEGLNVPQLSVPPIPGVEMASLGQSQGMSFVNGTITRSVSLVYRLHPHAAGVITIPSVRVSAGGVSAASEPLTLRVGLKSPPARPGTSQLFARLTVDKSQVYWNQEILARFTLFTRAELAGAPVWDPPNAPGFWTESMGPPRRGRVTLDGVIYDAMEIRIAYFPTRTGRLAIGPGQVHLQVVRREAPVNSWGIWALADARVEEVTLKTEQVAVEVDPLPPGAPDGFRGAVGKYQLDVRVDRLETRAGEPVTVVTDVKGEGNVASAGDPEVAASVPARTYAAGANTKIDRSTDRLRGERRRETAFVPETPGSISILPVRFSWFDPEEGRYRVQTSDSIAIHVLPPEPGGKGSLRGAPSMEPLASLRTRAGRGGSLSLGPSPASRAVALGSILAYLAAWGGLAVRTRMERDPARTRRRELGRLMNELQKLAGERAGSPGRAARLAEILLQAVGLRYGVEVAGRSDKEALHAAGVAGATDEDTARIAALLELLEREAFAPGLVEAQGTSASLEGVRELLSRYQQELA